MAETIVLITETTFSSHVFTHDYPKSSKIEAHYQSNGRLFISYYNIISLGTYPSIPKLTQKSKNNAIQYPIPDNYIVETEMFERSLNCKTKYISNSKVNYTINWKIGRAEWSVSSTKSSTAVVNTFLQKINQNPSTKLSGPRLFGFDIEPLYYARSQIGFQPITAGTNDKRKRPLEEITSQSQQNKRFKSFGEDVHKAVDELIIKHKLTNVSGESIIHLQQIGFDYKENQVCIKFKDPDPMAIQTRLDAIVRVCDEALLSRDGYRHLAATVLSLFHQDINQINDHNSDVHTGDILVNNYEVGNEAYRSLSILLKVLIPVWKGGKNPVIISEDTLYIKLGGDGRNVGRKQNHVMITFCLLNEKDNVLKPDHQYSICLYIGKEKYETLDKVGKIFAVQLADLKESGIIDGDGVHWPIKFYFSVDLHSYIPDELHILLRISDVLMECLFRDLFKKNDFERNFKEKIEKKMNDLNIHFEFYHGGSARDNWNWTSLMGPDKKKMLQHFSVSEFIPEIRGVDIEILWRKFYQLYEVLKKPSHTEEEISKFEEDVKNWVRTFCRPTIGQMNSATSIPGLYRKEDVTPYMHMLTMHVPYCMHQLKEKGLSLRLFSTSSIEKKNHNQVKLFFRGTTMGGGKKKLPVCL
ncbi:hypothetical protein GLOIN_2v1824261 [Rhizophagus irregularis DAOM 181602=DAOM 197198]|nr:hypothetical protein GLOIN_2v1824261 [Rhizophagus irregularis DAOM 181602=DAOM 197198]